jgi:hypothetical protein
MIRKDIKNIYIRPLQDDNGSVQPYIICKDENNITVEIIPISDIERLQQDLDNTNVQLTIANVVGVK